MNLVSLKERIATAQKAIGEQYIEPLFTPAERDWLLDLINATPEAMVADGRAEVHEPPNYMGRIEHLWAALSVDDGGEGLCAAPIQNGMLSVPLIAADRRRLDALRPIIKDLARLSNRIIRVAKFTKREDIGIITP